MADIFLKVDESTRKIMEELQDGLAESLDTVLHEPRKNISTILEKVEATSDQLQLIKESYRKHFEQIKVWNDEQSGIKKVVLDSTKNSESMIMPLTKKLDTLEGLSDDITQKISSLQAMDKVIPEKFRHQEEMIQAIIQVVRQLSITESTVIINTETLKDMVQQAIVINDSTQSLLHTLADKMDGMEDCMKTLIKKNEDVKALQCAMTEEIQILRLPFYKRWLLKRRREV